MRTTHTVTDDLVQAIQDSVETKTIVVDELEYTTRPVFAPPEHKLFETLTVQTLTGVVDYIRHDPDGLADDFFIQVDSPTCVSILQAAAGRNNKRPNPLMASCEELIGSPYPYGQYRSIEEAIVDLQAKFVSDENLSLILTIIGNVKDETVSNYADDGITQTVTMKRGLSGGSNEYTRMPPQITLKPRRTFPEIEQPEGTFIIRLKQNQNAPPSFALFESQCSAWKHSAIQAVKAYLVEQLPDASVIA